MTNKEAIEFLKNISSNEAGRCIGKEGTFYSELMLYHVEALSFAIKALEERPKGKWRIEAGIGCYCTNCGFDIGNYFDDLMEYVEFCPSCGASMSKGE